MTQRRDPEALLSAYLAIGMEVLPDRVVGSVLDEVHRTRQWAVFGPRRTRFISRTTFAAAAVVAMLVLAAALLVAGGGPGPAPTVEPRPSLQGVVPPNSTPSDPTPAPTPSPVTNPAGVWIAAGTMGTPRINHAMVRLLDGRVLMIGGEQGTNGEAATSPELYDPVTGSWSNTGSMLKGYEGFPPTVLRDGRVLVGDSDEPDDAPVGAEVYDPATGTWTATGQPVPGAQFDGGTATLLRDGRVLVAGSNGAQMYDPDSGTWTVTGKMTAPRYLHSATLLPDGRVLAVGGYVPPDVKVDSAEVYDPETGAWTTTASMDAPRGSHTATLLGDGRVLVAGMVSTTAEARFVMEAYDPATGTWTTLPERPGYGYGTPTLLSDGTVLMTDVASESGAAALYHPSTDTWTTAAPMLRSHATPGEREIPVIPLLDGTVLMAGGQDCRDGFCVPTGAAELYVPAGVTPPPLPAFPSPPPPVFPSPTPVPTPFPPEAGPVPPGARTWKVTVRNESSAPASLFLAEEGENGITQLCGSVTPNVVPAGVTRKVTFKLPPKKVKGCWIWVNPVPGQGGSLFETSDAPMAIEILIDAGGQVMYGG